MTKAFLNLTPHKSVYNFNHIKFHLLQISRPIFIISGKISFISFCIRVNPILGDVWRCLKWAGGGVMLTPLPPFIGLRYDIRQCTFDSSWATSSRTSLCACSSCWKVFALISRIFIFIFAKFLVSCTLKRTQINQLASKY